MRRPRWRASSDQTVLDCGVFIRPWAPNPSNTRDSGVLAGCLQATVPSAPDPLAQCPVIATLVIQRCCDRRLEARANFFGQRSVARQRIHPPGEISPSIIRRPAVWPVSIAL